MFAILPLLLAVLSLQPQPAISTGTLYPGGTLVGVDGIIVEESPSEPLTEPLIITIERIDINDYPRLRDTPIPNTLTRLQDSQYLIKVMPFEDTSEMVSVDLDISLSVPSDVPTDAIAVLSFNPAESQMPPGYMPPSRTPPREFPQIGEREDFWSGQSGYANESGTHVRFSTGFPLGSRRFYGLGHNVNFCD